MSRFWRRHAPKLIALVAVLGLYGAARLPSVSSTEEAALAARFRFAAYELPTVSGDAPRTLRAVHPDLEHLASWISSVGGAVALHDLDGDGLANDFCYVETRTDQVIVGCVPGVAPGGLARYPSFVLDPAPLPFDATMAPMGCMPGDFDENGHPDVLVYYWGRTPVLFLNRGTGGFDGARFARQELVEGGERWFTNAATSADFDGDGHVDLVFGNYFQDGAEILNPHPAGPARMQHSMSRAMNGGRNRLLLWTGAAPSEEPAARFREDPEAFTDEGARGWTLAIGAADLDGDLLPELYVANDFGPDRLLHNRSRPGLPRFALLRGEKTLTTPNSKVLGRDSFKGMGVDFADVNGDGRLDIYVSNIAAPFALEESHFLWQAEGDAAVMRAGRAPFRDRSESLGLSRSGWGWDSRLADFDNDGVCEAVQATGFVRGSTNRWPELHELAMGNDDLLRQPMSWPRFRPGDDISGHQHNPFFVRGPSGRFVDLAPQVGLGLEQVSRAIATADVDGDGDLDFAVGNQWEPSRFYRNDAPAAGTFLVLHLLCGSADEPLLSRPGVPAFDMPGSAAVGAEARVRTREGRVLMAQVDGGNGHSGDRSPELHFGLGSWNPDTPVVVTLRWRDRRGEIHQTDLPLMPGHHTVRLGQLAGSKS